MPHGSIGRVWWLPLLAVPLTQGAPDDADPAVVAIVRADGVAQCTGTVIAERVVLTAAHCGVQVDPSAYRVFFGAQISGAGITIDIVEAVAHPAYDDTEAHDLALVLLAEASPSAPVIAASSPPPAQLRIVGFGDTAGGALDGDRKREGTTMVTSSTPLSLVLGADPSLPCSGDSGGPAFATDGSIAAVISRGDPDCASYGKATRVDAHLADFIVPYVAATAPGTIDVGERCKYDAHCTSGACVTALDEPLLRYCSTACRRDGDCPEAMTCDHETCRYPVPTPGAIGSTCAATDECVRGECIDAGYCSVRCVSGRDDCPDDFACSHLGGIDFFCTPIPADGGCCDAGSSGSSGAVLCGLLLAGYLSRGRRCSSRCS